MLRDTLVSRLREGVRVHAFLIPFHRGPSMDGPYNVGRFRGPVFADCIPPAQTNFADTEMHFLVAREGGRGEGSDLSRHSGRSRVGMTATDPGDGGRGDKITAYDVRPLNHSCRRVLFTMATVSRVVSRFYGPFLRFSPYTSKYCCIRPGGYYLLWPTGE